MKTKIVPDIYMTLIVVSIILAGVLAIYVSEPIHNPNQNFFNNHFTLLINMFVLSLIIIFSPNFFPTLDKLVPIILFITLLLLIYVLIFGISSEGSYARRWIKVGGITLQSSEIAKLTSVIYFSSVLSKKGEKLSNWQKGLMPPLSILIIISILIMIEPDSSTAMLLAFVGFIMFFYAGIPLRSLIFTGVLLAVVFVVFIFNNAYMMTRITSYLDLNNSADDTYQIRRANLAFNLGGINGLNDEALIETSTHLPAAITDFIFASVAQRYGFMGNMIILLLFLSFTIRGFIISSRLENLFYKYIVFGVTMFISVQAYLNMMVATSLIPTTGIPLPFISYGRNALVINIIMVALLLKITRLDGSKQ